MMGAEGGPKAPVAEGGPFVFDGGTDGIGSPVCGGGGKPPALIETQPSQRNV